MGCNDKAEPLTTGGGRREAHALSTVHAITKKNGSASRSVITPSICSVWWGGLWKWGCYYACIMKAHPCEDQPVLLSSPYPGPLLGPGLLLRKSTHTHTHTAGARSKGLWSLHQHSSMEHSRILATVHPKWGYIHAL